MIRSKMMSIEWAGLSPPELVLGFGNVTESAIERGIAAIGDLLRARR
jgi:hypothetical protein